MSTHVPAWKAARIDTSAVLEFIDRMNLDLQSGLANTRGFGKELRALVDPSLARST